MQFKEPKDDEKYKWTNHVKDKMQYYGISASLIKRVVRYPKRKEEGIAPGTVAVMQQRPGKKKSEVWVMYQELKQNKKLQAQNPIYIPKVRIISAWRYPGVSPKGKQIPIPDDILQELESII